MNGTPTRRPKSAFSETAEDSQSTPTLKFTRNESQTEMDSNWTTIKILIKNKTLYLKRYIARKKQNMYNIKLRRESVASVYRKTTKFIASNTANLLKKMPNRKYRFLARAMEEFEQDNNLKEKAAANDDEESDNEDLGERDLDYYLGIRNKEIYWHDPTGIEQIRKDFLLYHCGVTEEDYEEKYKVLIPGQTLKLQPKFKEVPFMKRKAKKDVKECEKKGIFKLFVNKRDSDYSTSESYSECESICEEDEDIENIDEIFGDILFQGVRIKEVSEGRPCDNCPELCPGFIQHAWRKTCKSCGCDRLSHSVYHEELESVRLRLGLREGPGLYNDAPPGLTAKQSELYWQALSERAPTIVGGATGAAAWRAWRTRALAIQLPKQDMSLAHCRHMDEEDKKPFEDFVSARNEIALDIGVAYQHHGASIECMGCNKSIRNGAIAIQAPRIAEEASFHPACFTCSECDELLVELAYCAMDGRLFCVRHYADRLKPRCHSCDELIFSGEFTKAMNKDWHSGHFCCWQCDESLTGQRYVLRDEHPYCIKCYESVFANGCEECNKIIGIDSKDLSYKDKHWHEACFLCAKCRVSLVDKQFGSKLDKIYCGNCYDAQFASRCDGCGEVFRAGGATFSNGVRRR